MSSSKSALGRLFGALWAVFVGVYRAVVVLALLVVVGLVWFALQGGRPATVDDNVALVIYPTGSLMDTVDQDPGQLFVEQLTGDLPSQTLLRDLVAALEDAAEDPRIPVAVLKLDALWGAGLPQLQELSAAISKFRAAGKPVYAYGPYYEQGHYLVAAHADHVSLDPMGIVLITGFGIYQNYFREGLDKLGAKVHVFRVGEYKSAVEPFERNDMSAEAREAYRKWLTDLWNSFGRTIEQARQLPEAAVHQYVLALPNGLKRSGGDAAAFAQDRGLVDAVETLQQFRERMAARVGWDEHHGSFRQIHYSQYLKARAHEKRRQPRPEQSIALVVVQGEIVNGVSRSGFAGGETIAGLLSDVRQDDGVASLVLRVNSPGGSVFASEQIRRELRHLQADGKPVVVSMSSVAASGGYWVAMDADEIWAHDTTTTGSIGIFGLLLTLDQSLKKLGIHTDGIGTTPLAGAFRIDRPMSPEAAAVFQAQTDQGYRFFVEGVSAGRELPLEKVNELARGRVWSGSDALALGLVDQIGGLEDAIESAARLAGLEPGRYQLREFRPKPDFAFLKLLELAGRAQSSGLAGLLPEGKLRSVLSPAEDIARSLAWLNDPSGFYAHCFCVPSVSNRTH
jgi:protease IV